MVVGEPRHHIKSLLKKEKEKKQLLLFLLLFWTLMETKQKWLRRRTSGLSPQRGPALVGLHADYYLHSVVCGRGKGRRVGGVASQTTRKKQNHKQKRHHLSTFIVEKQKENEKGRVPCRQRFLECSRVPPPPGQSPSVRLRGSARSLYSSLPISALG